MRRSSYHRGRAGPRGPGGGRPHGGHAARADDGARPRHGGHEGIRLPRYVPPPAPERPEELRPTEREFRGLRLYPFQVKAVDAIAADHSVLVAAPTGSGKTLVADYAIEQAFAAGRRAVYTSPVKALSNQKFRDFRALHGDAVGIMTGDVTIHPEAPLLVMTTEVFRNTLFDDPERIAQFQFVIHDEVHYLDDPERGTVWEESIIHAPQTMRLVCLSATVPNVREMSDWIASVRGEDVTVVEMKHRPVPLDHLVWTPEKGPILLEQASASAPAQRPRRGGPRGQRSPALLLDWLERERLLPVLYFCFSRKTCESLAVENIRRTLLPPQDRERMAELLSELCRRYEVEDSPAVQQLTALALAGVAYHHAGMLPIHKEIVERLFTSGLVRMLFATETFALGVNMPARTVAFDSLRKFDGERMDYMLCREYGQMAGRAGRQGIDAHGLVIARVDPTFDRMPRVRRVMTGEPESVESRFDPNYSTILSLYQHMGDRVVETYEKSFAKFQRERRRGTRGGRSDEERVLAARLDLLKEHGYVDDEGLTAKGRFASRISGQEVQAAEWRAAGLFRGLTANALAVLLLAANYEPRIDEEERSPRDRSLLRVRDAALELVDTWRKAEWRAGLRDLSREPHFGMTAAIEAWLAGAELARCREMTSASEGDVVRQFRQILQYARQIQRALEAEESRTEEDAELLRTLKAVIRSVNRDEVDAKRQLELGKDPLEGDAVPPETAETPAKAEVREAPAKAVTREAPRKAETPAKPHEPDDFGVGVHDEVHVKRRREPAKDRREGGAAAKAEAPEKAREPDDFGVGL